MIHQLALSSSSSSSSSSYVVQNCTRSKKRRVSQRLALNFISMFMLATVPLRRTALAWTCRGILSRSCRRTIIATSTCLLAENSESNPQGKRQTKKFRVVDKIEQKHLDKLAEAFDELARKEGFGKSDAFFADEDTFEDDFDDDDDDDTEITRSQFSRSDIEKSSIDPMVNIDQDDDMEARLASARLDNVGGLSMEEFGPADLRELGFRRELNPFGDDETPRKEQFKIVTNAMICPACGADFQSSNEARPGYLPPEKFEIQVKLQKIEEIQKLQEKAKSEWSPEDEVEWLLQTGGRDDKEPAAEIDVITMAEEMSIDLFELSENKVICKRCHGLQNFGRVDEALRPGWTKEPLLSQDTFRSMLQPIREKAAVVIALVDLFDFAGSVLPELDSIAGDNPVIVAANKADLLPSKMGKTRAENWVRRELEYLGVKSLANVGGAVRLVSCKTGAGVASMLSKARALAKERDCDIYVVGAANAGKSTLLNRILAKKEDERFATKKNRAGNRNAFKGAVTTSPLPGTTLKFIEVNLGDGVKLYDTPGLLISGSLTQLLTPDELKIVVPKKQVEPVTFRLAAGKCVLVGGLARVELVGESKPFLFTFFVANEIKLHPTDGTRADEVTQKHIGEMLVPPLPPGQERLNQIGEFEDHLVDIEGVGWKEAAADLCLTGLGWVSVTGAGSASVKVSVPKGIGVSVRPPLMPFDVWETTAKYTGTRAVRKISKKFGGKRNKGVGRN